MAGGGAPDEAKGAIGVALLLVTVCLIADTEIVSWALGLPVLLLTAFAISRAPLRYAVMGMMACALILENPSDQPACGAYRSPLYPLGALMLQHMNVVTGQKWMFFSGMDLLIVVSGIVALQRNASKVRIDSRGRVKSPKAMIQLAHLSYLGMGVILLWGMLRGGEFQKAFWQLDKMMYLPTVYLIAEAGIRGSKDAMALGRVVVFAALYKAGLVLWIKNYATLTPPDAYLDYAVTHHDSVLFALAMTTLVSAMIHRVKRSSVRNSLLCFPLLIAGMVGNDRRMVWVQVGLVFTTLYFVMPMTPIKKKIRKILLATSPLTVAYAVIGWAVPRGPFKPIATVKSVLQPAQDLSTMLRDIENYNITQTFRAHPVFGTGLGVGYTQYIPLPPMPHPLEHWLPHNSLLGIWFAMGFVGYTALTLLWTTGVFFGVRAYRFGRRRIERTAALVCFGSVLMYMIQCYGDIGIGSWIAVFCVSPSLALAGKLAVETGAWSDRKPPRAQTQEDPAADGVHAATAAE